MHEYCCTLMPNKTIKFNIIEMKRRTSKKKNECQLKKKNETRCINMLTDGSSVNYARKWKFESTYSWINTINFMTEDVLYIHIFGWYSFPKCDASLSIQELLLNYSMIYAIWKFSFHSTHQKWEYICENTLKYFFIFNRSPHIKYNNYGKKTKFLT